MRRGQEIRYDGKKLIRCIHVNPMPGAGNGADLGAREGLADQHQIVFVDEIGNSAADEASGLGKRFLDNDGFGEIVVVLDNLIHANPPTKTPAAIALETFQEKSPERGVANRAAQRAVNFAKERKPRRFAARKAIDRRDCSACKILGFRMLSGLRLESGCS